MSMRHHRIAALLLVLVFGFVGLPWQPNQVSAAAGRWERLSIYGGNIRSLANLPSNPSTVIATVWGRGIFRSTDGGVHWSETNTGVDIRQVNDAVGASDGTFYVGSFGGGVYRSTDAGISWTGVTTGLETGIMHLAMSASSPSILYAASGAEHLFASTDKGAHWARCADLPDGGTIESIAVSPTSAAVVYVATTKGLYYSIDSGGHWAGVDTFNGRYIRGVACVGTIMLAGVDNDLYRRPSETEPWVKVDTQGEFGVYDAFAGRGGSVLFAASAWSSHGVMRSTDGGQTWVAVRQGLGNLKAGALLVLPDGVVLAGTNGSGVYRSTDDGISWGSSNSGLAALNVTSLTTQPGMPDVLIAGAEGGVYRSEDRGATWSNITAGSLTNSVNSVLTTPSSIMAGTQGSSIYSSTDGGATWSMVPYVDRLMYIYSMLATGFASGSLYAGGQGKVWRSTDGGANWLPTSIETLLQRTNHVVALAIGPRDNVIYAGTKDRGVYCSTDDGATWMPVSDGLGANAQIFGLSCIKGKMYACTKTGTFVLDESKSLWAGLSSATSNRTTVAMVAVGDDLFMAWENTVARSIDTGQNWTAESTGLDRTTMTGLVVVGESVYATATDGVYRWMQEVRHRVTVAIAGESIGATVTGPTAADVADGGTASFTLTLNTGFEATVSRGTYDKKSGVWSIPDVHGDVTAQMTVRRIEGASFTAVLVIGNSTMLAGDKMITLDAPPYIKGGRTMLPLRAISEAFGGDVEWNPTERKVTVRLGGHTVLLWIGKNTAQVDGRSVPIDSANPAIVPEIVAGRTFVPLRFVAESTGLQVTWTAETRTVTIRRE